jgi:microbial collagenase
MIKQSFTVLLAALSLSVSHAGDEVRLASGNVVREGEVYSPAWVRNQSEIETVLSHSHDCSENLVLRHQAMTPESVTMACTLLLETETRFHILFGTAGKPVLHDHNTRLRANIYASKDEYVAHVTRHFDVPSDNGGMYLEGLPQLADSSAEYVAYMKDGKVHNLNHEFVHYLDGRFNLYGDYCANLHDNHAGPEYCPEPAPMLPYLIWWAEGIGEYVSKMDDNSEAVELAGDKTYQLSELFNNSVAEWDTARVYSWGYLAVRFMVEERREQLEEMLFFTRTGDYPRYQALVRRWGIGMDADFHAWLDTLKDRG